MYGKCLYCNTTYNFCKKQSALTTLCGLNGFIKIVVFGFAVALDEISDATYKILKTFFEF